MFFFLIPFWLTGDWKYCQKKIVFGGLFVLFCFLAVDLALGQKSSCVQFSWLMIKQLELCGRGT